MALAVTPNGRRLVVAEAAADELAVFALPSGLRLDHVYAKSEASIELILGMKPLGFPDAVATPMYDAFQRNPANSTPYTVRAPTYPPLQRNANTAANRAVSRGYDFVHPERVPQNVFDRVLWRSVHGAQSAPPPPGPNAMAGQ